MTRDDLNRRRLRGLYDRNKRRVAALADARDRRREGDDEVFAPRRYVVSERRTRTEGFGRGGVQVRQVIRRVTRLPPREMFRSRGIFRRGNRDRFRRDDGDLREGLRERFQDRFQERRRGGGRGNRERGGRLGDAARSRLRLRRRQRPPPPPPRGRGNETPRGGALNERGGGNQRRPRPAREKFPTREQLDAQLDRFRAN
ncbi:unnamed protein product [Phytomonas sp. EM1]|nr:unnamed protein product [Phytomonas sp. EM1]|eukprot:CCW61778.1 unnamed protein product [Phytomonas sp. isolate EM1]